jgi:hypothetical protein
MSVTATANGVTAPRGGLAAALSASLTRNQFFAGLYILGCANGLLGRILQSISFDNWMGAAIGIDLNVVVLFACFAGLAALLATDGEREAIRPLDLAAAAAFLALVILPIYPLSWAAVTGLSLYILLFANDGSERRRGAIILLALTVPMLWSRLLFQFFAKPILDIDAALVAALLGTERAGNTVQFADGTGFMVVLAPCSSLANMSLAFLSWVAITQWARHRWSPIDLLWSSLACASVIAVNVTRISLMGVSRDFFNVIHGERGDLVTNTVMLVLMVTFSVIGARRELFARS